MDGSSEHGFNDTVRTLPPLRGLPSPRCGERRGAASCGKTKPSRIARGEAAQELRLNPWLHYLRIAGLDHGGANELGLSERCDCGSQIGVVLPEILTGSPDANIAANQEAFVGFPLLRKQEIIFLADITILNSEVWSLKDKICKAIVADRHT